MAKKQQMVIVPTVTLGIRGRLHSLIAFLVAVVLIAAVYLTGDGGWRQLKELGDDVKVMGHELGSSSLKKCDMFSGKWVFDNNSYPLYKEKQCRFMSDQLACEKFGRKDLSFQNWRWQPHHCDLPRFNGTALMERLRNKRLVYVGDSLNRNQWVSMVCLLESSLPVKKLTSMHTTANDSLTIFKAIEYNASIEFYWAPLLVESNSDDPVNHRLPDRIVRVRAIEKHAKHWTDADVLVFNSYLWWRKTLIKALWGSFESSDGIYKEVDMPRIYEMALNTWSDWLEIHVNRTKTQLFFMSMSPTHQSAKEWGADASENCYNETEPITKEGYEGDGWEPKMMQIVERVVEEMKGRGLDVKMINITQMADYRKDGHPTVYRKQWEVITEEQMANPSSYADCIHWCLPGVPDVWNQLLYAYIFQPQN